MPLTCVLHSLGVNQNQYGALNPRLLQQLCERRGSVCASTLGYGPDGKVQNVLNIQPVYPPTSMRIGT